MICVVELQILSKIIATKDFSIIEDNNITEEYFLGQKDRQGRDTDGYVKEFRFIKEHYDKYGNVPDKETFLSAFPIYRDGGLPEVNESDEWLVTTLREERTFKQGAPILQKASEIFLKDANAGVEYMLKSLKELEVNYGIGGVDIIAEGNKRLEHYKERVANQKDWYFTTGFAELDNILHGIQRFEELVVLFARLGQGKSWLLVAIISHIWKLGFNVGYISPEMSDDNIGYRFDTIHNGYSNRSLMWGLDDIDIEKYEQDIAKLKEQKNKYIVSVPLDFDNRITVSKLRNYIKQNKLDVLAIDGITYLTDERYRRGDSETLSLTHISQDLMALSVELKVPILVVSQANREGARDDVPDITNISHSDGIAQSASKVIALRQDDGNLEMLVEKNRYGGEGKKLRYIWNINVGEFIYTENTDDMTKEQKEERREKKKASGKDVF